MKFKKLSTAQGSLLVFLLKRCIHFFLLLFAVSTLVFFLIHIIPGDPAVFILGEHALPKEISQVHKQLKLDIPLCQQYLQFLNGLIHLDLGKSLFTGLRVTQSILNILPYTLSLACLAMSLALLFSFPPAIYGAFKENTIIDTLITLFSAMSSAIPSFFLGPLLMVLFSIQLKWLPLSGTGGFKYLILPALTLAITISTPLIRFIKAALVNEIHKPYVLLAKAKGLSPIQIFFYHLLKNAMIPIITIIGLQMGTLLTGTVIIETVFSRPGIGHLLINAIFQRDYPMLQGVVVFIIVVYLGLNFLIDLSYYFLDPRLRYNLQSPALHAHISGK